MNTDLTNEPCSFVCILAQIGFLVNLPDWLEVTAGILTMV